MARGVAVKRGSLKQQHVGELIAAETIDAIVKGIVQGFSPEKIVLFGSYANGNPTPDSDLDLLVVMDSDLPRHKRAAPLMLMFRPALCAMDILVYTHEEVAEWNGTVNHIITEVLNSGKVVYEH